MGCFPVSRHGKCCWDLEVTCASSLCRIGKGEEAPWNLFLCGQPNLGITKWSVETQMCGIPVSSAPAGMPSAPGSGAPAPVPLVLWRED